jgi:flagellar motor protein MotB
MKKYKLLEADYQKVGEAQRSYEQDHRILQVELQDMKQRLTRLETENRTLDSINYVLHQKIMFSNTDDNWKEKYETLLQAYEKLAPADLKRGAPDENKETKIATPSNPSTQVEKKEGKRPPVIVRRDKPYLTSGKEVKLPDSPTKAEEKTTTKEEPKAETTAEKQIAENVPVINYTQQKIDALDIELQKILENYKLNENITKKEQQITVSFSDEFLFAGEKDKFSDEGEAVLQKLIYTFSQHPRLTVELISEGTQAEEKSKKIGEMLRQYNINTRILPKNNVPLAFETSGTHNAVNFLTLRMD